MKFYSNSAAVMCLYGIILLQLMSPMLATTTTKAPTPKVETSTISQAETTISTTQASTLSTTITTTTTVSPELGANCTSENASWCNDAISGDAVCNGGACVCTDTYVMMNSTACISASDLTPALNVTAVHTSSIEVSWTLQESVSNLAVVFAVTADDTAAVNCTVTGAAKTAECSTLSSGYKYNITVTAIYTTAAGGILEGQSSVQEVTKPSTPGSLNISASNLNTPNVTLTWTHSDGRVDYYSVKVTASGNVDTVGDEPETVIVGLEPGRDYNVTITSISYNRSSDKKQDMFRTVSTVPDPPLLINVLSVTNSFLEINWTETDHPNGRIEGHQVCLKHKVYDDEAFTEPVCDNTTAASVRVYEADNLTAGTWYEFIVFTINDLYISSDSIKASQRTNEAVPMDVSGLSATPMNVSIRVTWQRPTQPHGDIIMYRVDWNRVDNADQNCTVYLSNSSNNNMANNCYHNITDPSTIILNQKNMTYTIDGLESHTTYDIKVAAYTSVGAGTVASIQMQTTIAVPEPVTDVNVEVVNATSVRVSWSIPALNPGPVNYTVRTKDMIEVNDTRQTCSAQGYNSSSCVVSGLEAFWLYRFNVVAATEVGTSNPVESHNITTDETVPGQISDHSFELFNATNDCDATKVTVHWTEPALRDRNSNITRYLFQKFGEEILYPVLDPDPYNPVNRSFQENMTRLEADTSHTWTIRAQSNSGIAGDTTNISVTTEVCAPPSWNEAELRAITEVRSSPSSVTIALPLTFFEKEEQGSIQEKGFIVLPEDSSHYENTASIKFEDLNNWKSVSVGTFKKEYKIRIEGKVAEFEIGIDSHCNTDVVVQDFCNGPLPEQFSFKIAAYVCTRLASTYCRYSEPHGPFATQAKPVPPPAPGGEGWIIAVAILFVIGALVGAFVLLWYKKVIDPKTCLYRQAPDDTPPFSTLDRMDRHRPIIISHFDSVLENMHRDTNLLLSDQYDDINRLGEQIVDASTKLNATLDSNTPKNRWVNILPFDHSRVKLQQIDDDDPTSDYINANYMPGFNSKREYIATQGPLPGTIDDFWRMVWEHSVNVIVMLTQCKEGSRVKCEKYWPDELREPKQYGDVVVNPVSISQLDKYNITIFYVTVNNQSRQVIHFHYLDFPDFSANVEFDHFIKFVISVRHHVPHDMLGPMVIHCSAGVGRTGTFIAIDRLNLYLNSSQFDEKDEVDIFGIVVSLRENRVAMVQTESQYVMIHDCFEQMLEDKKKSMQMTDSEENLYANQGFDPYPEVVYENVSATQQQTEL